MKEVAVPAAVWVLFLSPTAAMLAGLALRAWRPRWTHWPILISCAAVTAASFSLAARVYAGNWGLDVPLGAWMTAGSWEITFGIRVDGIGSAVLCMVSLVGALIHLYASGYMREDPGFPRFMLVFHLFYLCMIGLLLSNNLAQLYLFWEGVGVASYFLIGFWTRKKPARDAALQAFLVNRVGDAGLLMAVLLLLAVFGHTRFQLMFDSISQTGSALIPLAAFFILWGAAAKSAQIPLYFWLPDAMEGPTPASALMHAATMVTAGIFLAARCWPLISSVPGLPDLVAWVGAATAIFAGLLACAQTDLKRILAYSTVSHLGLMAFALGLGSVGVAVFHLVIHGFFKATLFLCAGNIAHGLHKSTAGVSEVGGLWKSMPLTCACFVLAALSLAGIWPAAGFYSKDAVLHAALGAGVPFAVAGMLASLLGAFYIFRMLFLTFLGPRREQKPPAMHEPDGVMAGPAALLAVGSLGAGWLAASADRLLGSGAMSPAGAMALPHFSWTAFAAGTLPAALGIGGAWLLTTGLPSWDWEWRKKHAGLASFVSTDFGFRTLAGLFPSGFLTAGGWLGRVWDKKIWDGLIEWTAEGAAMAARAGAALPALGLNDYLWWVAAAAAVFLGAGAL